MSELGLMLVGVFVPLFPFSMAFNAAFERASQPALRVVLLLVWPQIGLWGLSVHGTDIPTWFVAWALASSLLYAFRLLAMREMGRWIGFLATSTWGLLWLPACAGVQPSQLWTIAAAFSVPLVFLVALTRRLEHGFGAAYTGLYGGLAQRMPRFSGVLVISVLAATATPVFPTFFAMLNALIVSQPVAAVSLTGIWLVWSWAAARLLQGLIVGAADPSPALDLRIGTTWLYAAGFVAFILAGMAMIGSQL